VLYLLQHPDIAAELGQEGKEHIRQDFLIRRLIKEELSLIKSLLQD